MPRFSNSPLFKNASRELRKQSREVFRGSVAGQLGQQIKAAARIAKNLARGGRGGGGVAELTRAVERLRSRGAEAAIQEIKGLGFQQMVGQVERYARQSDVNRIALNELFEGLGPTGEILKAAIFGGKQADIDALVAQEMLRNLGFGVLPPRQARTAGNVKRAALEAIEYLRQMGVPVDVPEEFEFQPQGRPVPPRPIKRAEPLEGPAERRKAIRGEEPSLADAGVPGLPGLPPDHPLVTGDMVPAPDSSNVHSVGYDASTGFLYVRFLDHRGKDTSRREGPLYQYRGVDPQEFLNLYRYVTSTGRAGDWVWDNLRIRGTLSGHRKDFTLVGVTGGYVPRKATLVSTEEAAKFGLPTAGEAYIQRKILTTTEGWLQSSKPNALVIPWHRGEPNRGKTGAPNTGLPPPPNRG